MKLKFKENQDTMSGPDFVPARRRFMKTAGVGVVGAMAAPTALGQMCLQEKTGGQPLGPFFPNPGTPSLEVREDKNPNTPIYLANDNDLTYVNGLSGKAQGQVVYVFGKVTDSECRPVSKATIIIWQASASGRYNHRGDADNADFPHPITGQVVQRNLDPHFQYWGRTVSNEKGEYIFKTIVPGFYPADLQQGWYRPPHIHFMVSATGYAQLVTQLYFKGQHIVDNAFIQQLNQKDYLLQSSSLTSKQRSDLVVNFQPSRSGYYQDGLHGQFDLKLSR